MRLGFTIWLDNIKRLRIDSPTWGPSGVLILTMEPAGASHALPARMGRVNSSIRTRGAFCMVAYASLSTDSGDPAVGRYAGGALGMLSLALIRCSMDFLA